MAELNNIQFIILKNLRHSTSARFSELQKPTGLESDAFKFYLRRLQQLGYVGKQEDGTYQLTAVGKEFANDLDENKAYIQKRPKLSAFLIVKRAGAVDEQAGTKAEDQYLFQRRQRNPYMSYWGVISGPVHWGEPTLAAAERELDKQTGLRSQFAVTGFCRVRDFYVPSGQLLEDKLFVVMTSHIAEGELANSWHGGHNQWLTLRELAATDKHFAATGDIIRAAEAGQTYLELEQAYRQDAY